MYQFITEHRFKVIEVGGYLRVFFPTHQKGEGVWTVEAEYQPSSGTNMLGQIISLYASIKVGIVQFETQ